jgi:hypothetical protein
MLTLARYRTFTRKNDVFVEAFSHPGISSQLIANVFLAFVFEHPWYVQLKQQSYDNAQIQRSME